MYRPERAAIKVTHRYTREMTADALNALQSSNTPPWLFKRGNTLVRVSDQGKLNLLDQRSLKGILDRAANFVREQRTGNDVNFVPARVPSDVTNDILSYPDAWPFPKLECITQVPVVLPHGNLLLKEGYDASSGLLLKLEGLDGVHADMPLEIAVDLLLNDVFVDFPYVEAAGKAHTLALLLQTFVRPLITGPTPLYLIDAPAQGTGKGLLSDTVAHIVTGKTAPVMALPREDSELEKRITAMLLASQNFILLDNVTKLEGDALNAALTSELWRGRRLGASEMLQVNNHATWLATGNNVELNNEMLRRTIPIRLDAEVERPEDRQRFKHKLPQFAIQNRTRIVSACISLVKSWIDAGYPYGTATLGRFESWAETMGGILMVAGVPGFLEGRERLYSEAEDEVAEWGRLCRAWFETYGTRSVTAKDLFDVVTERHLLVELWTGRKQTSAFMRIGRALKIMRGRVFSGYRIVHAGKDSYTRNASYRLEPIPDKTPETPGTLEVGADKPLPKVEIKVNKPTSESPESTESSDNFPHNTDPASTVTDAPKAVSAGVSGVSDGIAEKSSDATHPLMPALKARLEQGMWEVPNAQSLLEHILDAEAGNFEALTKVNAYLDQPTVQHALM